MSKEKKETEIINKINYFNSKHVFALLIFFPVIIRTYTESVLIPFLVKRVHLKVRLGYTGDH